MKIGWLLLFASVASANEFRLPPGAHLVDLTLPLDEHTPYWPMKPRGRFELTPIFCGSQLGFYFCMNRLATPEHGGTHVDAPSHFAELHPSIDRVPLQRLMAPAVVIDMSEAVRKDRDAQLTRADVVAWEKAHGAIEPGTLVLVRTGWSAKLREGLERYYGTDKLDDASTVHFPGVALDAAGLFVQRHIAAIGIDGPSIDAAAAHEFPAHRTLLGADIPQLENLASLAELPVRGAFVIALPIKIAGGTGAPARVVAIVP